MNNCQLRLDDVWVTPLLTFRHAHNLQSASVTLLHTYSIRGSTADTCTAFSEVLRRKMLGWSDVDALEAIKDFKDMPWKDKATRKRDWQTLADANNVTLDEDHDDV